MTEAGAGNSDHHLARARVRLGYLLKLLWCLRLQKSVREDCLFPLETLRGPVLAADVIRHRELRLLNNGVIGLDIVCPRAKGARDTETIV